MGGNASAYVSGSNIESAFLGSLGFLGGPSNSGLNGINSLDQQTTPTTEPSTIPTSWVTNGPPPQNFNPITAPQFFDNETKGPFKFLGQRYYNKVINSNPSTTSSSPNYLEYILIGGGALILVVIISKNNKNSE